MACDNLTCENCWACVEENVYEERWLAEYQIWLAEVEAVKVPEVTHDDVALPF